MQGKQANPFLWQVGKTAGAFKAPTITPKSTQYEVRYATGQAWVVDVLNEWLKMGRRELLSLDQITNWHLHLNPPMIDIDTPMDVIMFWAGVKSVWSWMSTNVVD